MYEPPRWVRWAIYVVVALIAVWIGCRLAWWIGGMPV